MNLKNKLKNIPQIYYLNLDEREDRKNYIESQLENLEIKNYQRYSTSKYKIDNFKDWKSKIIYDKNINFNKIKATDIIEVAQTIMYINLFEDWLKNSDDDYVLIIEDDCSLSTVNYWHFDWDYFMNNIPYDWDVLQLSYENRYIYPCFLHPTLENSGMGALLINRYFAEKIIRLHKINDRYCVDRNINKISSYYWGKGYKHSFFVGDYFPKISRSYSIPLLYSSVNFGRHDRETHIPDSQKKLFKCCEYACLYWWKKLRDNYTLEEFFTYGKPNDKYIKFKWEHDNPSIITEQ
jgi:hypothetical protein